MSNPQGLQKEVPPVVVGIVAIFFMISAAIIGGRAGNILEVFGGWGFSIGFTVMMWKRTHSVTEKVLLIVLLLVAIGASSHFVKP